MTDQKPVEDQILIDLFRQEHGSTGAKSLDAYSEHTIAQLVKRHDILHVGDGYFHITMQGQRRITAKYPDLWQSPYPSYLRYAPKPNERKAGRRQRKGKAE